MVRKLASYLFSNYLSVLLNIIRSFTLTKILVPESLGAWSILSTLLGYFRYYNLGFNSLAYYRSGKSGSLELYSSLLIRTNLFLTIVFGIFYTIFFGLTQINQFSTTGYFPIIIVFFMSSIFITQFSETYVAINKLGAKFSIIASYTNILAISGFFFVVGGAFYGNLIGMLFGNLISSILGFFYLRTRTKIISFPYKLYFRRLKIFFIRSSKMILTSILSITYTSLDIWMINYRYSLSENGYFSLIQTFTTVLLILPSSVAVFYYSSNPRKLINNNNQVFKLTAFNFIFTSILVVVSFFFMKFVVFNFIPNYKKSVEIFSVLAFSIPFLSIRNVMVDMLIVKNIVKPLNILIICLIILKISLLSCIKIDLFYFIVAGLNVCYGLIVISVFTYNHYQKSIKI
jgi:O-antigen/teichoic acid export membrane protein